jgi:hypothetical protein
MAEISTEALEAAARAAFVPHCSWPDCVEKRMSEARVRAQAVLTAAAPYLIAEGRWQVIAELRQLATPAGPLLTPLQIVKILELGARIATKGAPDG